MDTGNAKVTFSQHGHVLFTLVNYTVSHKTMATTVKKICEYVKTHKPKLNIERMMHDLKYEFINDSKT